MRRALATWLSALFLIALVSSTAFAGKPTVAILGLEVTDATGNIDQVSTQVAKDLTEGLRSRAKAGTGPYQLVAGGDKELIDEKLINNCENEAIPCMAAIGDNLGADYLVYGRLEKRADGYVVTINLLNVKKKKFEKAKTPLVIQQKDPAALQAAAKKAYNDLTGITETGTLVVTANGDGTVFLDDENKGTLSGGSLTISGLAENRYRLVVESRGTRSPETIVTIRSGETTNQAITLAGPSDISREVTGTTSSSSGGNVWKPIFYVSLVATVGLGGTSAVGYFKQRSAAKDAESDPSLAGQTWDNGSCGSNQPAGLDDVCKWHKVHKYTAIGAGIVGVVMIGSGILAFKGSSERSTPPASAGTVGRRTKKKREFSVTPVVSAQGGGATFQIDW